MKATVTESGQVSIPARPRHEMHLEPGQTVLWKAISATECRLITVRPETSALDPLAALGFARQHGLEEGSTGNYLKELRAGEEDAG